VNVSTSFMRKSSIYLHYAQRYLGYPGSLGEFTWDCTITVLQGEGVEVALKLLETT